MQKKIFAIISLALLALSTNSFAADKNGAAWSYTGATGPENWGKLDPAYSACETGKHQTPIDIEKATPKNDNTLAINYTAAPLQIMDDGDTTLNINHKQIIFNDGHTVQLNFASDGKAPELIQFNNHGYHLVQLHFHTPSETQLNGEAYPAEIHFVNQDDAGRAAVIAVFVQEGPANPDLQKVLDNFPKTPNKLSTVKNISIDPNGLIPINHSFYSFDGSLTTPPCTEPLRWLVLQQPITASAQQIQQLNDDIGGDNARPVQPLNQRQIFITEVK